MTPIYNVISNYMKWTKTDQEITVKDDLSEIVIKTLENLDCSPPDTDKIKPFIAIIWPNSARVSGFVSSVLLAVYSVAIVVCAVASVTFNWNVLPGAFFIAGASYYLAGKLENYYIENVGSFDFENPKAFDNLCMSSRKELLKWSEKVLELDTSRVNDEQKEHVRIAQAYVRKILL